MATSSASGRGSSNREGGAKAIVADQISQAVQSTSNLLHLMQQSSPSQMQRYLNCVERQDRSKCDCTEMQQVL
ncbi:uncharacterized protein J3R85_001957 [Psidium guajava]|nr:uncharacterized protein J3R85_001957 [Psidium guajava]